MDFRTRISLDGMGPEATTQTQSQPSPAVYPGTRKENMELDLKPINTRQAIEDAHADLFIALRYGLTIGHPTDALDREHVEKACAILDLIRKANPL